MMNETRAAGFALLGLCAVAMAPVAARAASGDEPKEATALNSGTISLSKAIATAEQQTGGRAYDAGVDLAGGQTRIVVETNGPKGVQTVALDAQNGAVLSTMAGGEQD